MNIKDIVRTSLREAGITKRFQDAVEAFRDEQLKMDKLRDEQDALVAKFKKSSPEQKEKLKKDLIAMHKKVKSQRKSVEQAERKFNKMLVDEPEDFDINEARQSMKFYAVDKDNEIKKSFDSYGDASKWLRDNSDKGYRLQSKADRERMQQNEAISRQDMKLLQRILDNNPKLSKLKDPLKAAGFDKVTFYYSPFPHFRAKKKGTEVIITRDEFAKDAEVVSGNLAAGIVESVKLVKEGSCGSCDEYKRRLREATEIPQMPEDLEGGPIHPDIEEFFDDIIQIDKNIITFSDDSKMAMIYRNSTVRVDARPSIAHDMKRVFDELELSSRDLNDMIRDNLPKTKILENVIRMEIKRVLSN